MYVVTPQVSKIIRHDPFLWVEYNCPLACREIIDDLGGEKYDVISFGNKKYHRIMSEKNIEQDAVGKIRSHQYLNNDGEILNTLSGYTKFTPEESYQNPAGYFYIQNDIYDKLTTDPSDRELQLQVCAYLYEFSNVYRRHSADMDVTSVIVASRMIDIVFGMFKFKPEEIQSFIEKSKTKIGQLDDKLME